MKKINRLLLFPLLLLAAPAFSYEAMQVWACEMDDATPEEEVQKTAAEWLKAARGMKGGENLQSYVYFPVAVSATDEVDFLWVVTAPTFEEWGRFWDNYNDDSPAAQVDSGADEKFVCPDSSVWEAVKVK